MSSEKGLERPLWPIDQSRHTSVLHYLGYIYMHGLPFIWFGTDQACFWLNIHAIIDILLCIADSSWSLLFMELSHLFSAIILFMLLSYNFADYVTLSIDRLRNQLSSHLPFNLASWAAYLELSGLTRHVPPEITDLFPPCQFTGQIDWHASELVDRAAPFKPRLSSLQCVEHGKSHFVSTGTCQFLGSSLVSWSSRRQSSVA